MSEVNGTTANHGNDNIQSNIESLAGSVWVPDVTDQTCKPTEPTNQPDSGERMFAQLTGTFLFRILATRLYRVPSARSSIFKSISRYSIWER